MKKNKIKSSDIVSLLEKQSYKCAYTGDELTTENTSADHRTPVTLGGEHAIENIAMVTRQVNAAKGTMSLPEFVEMCGKVWNHLGPKQELKRVA